MEFRVSAVVASIAAFSVAAGAMTQAPATAAAPAGFCTALKQMVASASEAPGFKSIAGPVEKDAFGGGKGRLVPNGFKSCQFSRSAAMGDSYTCSGDEGLAKEALTERAKKLTAEISTCLAADPVKPDIMALAGENHMTFRVMSGSRPVEVYVVSRFFDIPQRQTVLGVKVGGRVK